MKWIVICAFGMLMLASGQVVSQKLLAGDEPTSLLQQDDNTCQSFGCDLSLRGNGVCDSSCDFWQCDFDGKDCKKARCAKRGCTQELLANNECDFSCKSADCDWDNGKCSSKRY